MPIGTTAALAIAAGASAVGGGLAAGRSKKVKVEQTFDPTASALRGQLQGVLSNKLKEPLSLDPNLLAGALGNLNKAYGSGVNSLQSQFSSRGLGQSGLFGGSLSNLDLARRGKIGDVINQLTGTADERQRATIAQALQLASPTGSTQTQPGSLTAGLGAGLGDLGQTLGFLSALGLIGGKKSSTSGLGSVSDIIPGILGK